MTPARRAAAAFLCAKALAVAALLAGLQLYFTPLHHWNYIAFTDRQAGALLAFINWDGQHYLHLALHGYPTDPGPSSAFFPLFPALVALGGAAGLHPIAAALLIVTAASAAVFVLLARLLPAERSRPSSLWLLAGFPTAFYLSVAYAEALFLAALLGLFLAVRTPGHAAWAAVCAAALPLTRAQGLWMAIPLAATWVALARPGGIALDRRALAGATAGYVAGLAGYFGFFLWQYGDPLAGIGAQQAFVFNNEVRNLFDLARFRDFLLEPPRRFLDTNNSGLDKLMIGVSLVALAAGARYAKDPLLLATWICLALLPAMMGEGGSYARHALLAWACFAVAAGPALPGALKWTILVPGFALQAYLAFCFGANRWVG